MCRFDINMGKQLHEKFSPQQPNNDQLVRFYRFSVFKTIQDLTQALPHRKLAELIIKVEPGELLPKDSVMFGVPVDRDNVGHHVLVSAYHRVDYQGFPPADQRQDSPTHFVVIQVDTEGNVTETPEVGPGQVKEFD